ncbi:hypothetical protein [Kitasatospora purpeofusca]|uniref:hypothetical protein n=1 Tax=Kitasatospora purpeofusca TaxID=67352 RepID=UPI003865A191
MGQQGGGGTLGCPTTFPLYLTGGQSAQQLSYGTALCLVLLVPLLRQYFGGRAAVAAGGRK